MQDGPNEDAGADDPPVESGPPAVISPPERPRIPGVLPILPLRDSVGFPDMVIPLVVGRESSVKLVDDVLVRDKLVALVTQKDPATDDPDKDDIYGVGVAGLILKMFKFPDETVRILVQGLARVRIGQILHRRPYLVGEVVVEEEQEPETTPEFRALAVNMGGMFQRLIDLVPGVPEEIRVAVANIHGPARLADFIASHLNLSIPEKQSILEKIDPVARLKQLVELMGREVEVAEIGSRIQDRIKAKMERGQREHLLREQLKAIQQELGDQEGKDLEIDELREKVESVGLSEEAHAEADKELTRLARMNPASPEYSTSVTWLEWLTDLPWQVSTEDNLDIQAARKILDRDHWGLEKVKDRIIEFIAVRKLKPDGRSPILCFVGPPGVGKTSLGRSIAESLGRKFARLSLGGVRDEAEIRGHRRTYVGALPGKIIQVISRAGTRNPLVMLDEIDKLGADFRGDPSSALLEVLDPEQNSSFVDHYLNLAFDLSHVLFIVTANVLDTIPRALRDRLEIIHLPGYSEPEKLQIAKRYLISEQIANHGLKKGQVRFEDAAVSRIIREYTREAGVRNLEREIGAVCRKIAVKVASGEIKSRATVTHKNLPSYLGPQRNFFETVSRVTGPGVAVGLAWTPVGGDILFIESARMPGSGKLILTGQLGNVMQESARAALSLVRGMSARLGIPVEAFQEEDIHIHLPEGAIPKDGPSAGVALSACLISLLSGVPLRADTAMTGEITLRGKVLPVGGVKEKILAAKRSGIKRVLLPALNRNDVEEIPASYRKQLQIIYVKTIEDVLQEAFKQVPGKAPGRERKKTTTARGRAKSGAAGRTAVAAARRNDRGRPNETDKKGRGKPKK